MEDICGGWLLPGETLGLWGGSADAPRKKKQDRPPLHLPNPSPPGTYHQLQCLVEESVALAVQVGIGAPCFGHTDPGKAGLL